MHSLNTSLSTLVISGKARVEKMVEKHNAYKSLLRRLFHFKWCNLIRRDLSVICFYWLFYILLIEITHLPTINKAFSDIFSCLLLSCLEVFFFKFQMFYIFFIVKTIHFFTLHLQLWVCCSDWTTSHQYSITILLYTLFYFLYGLFLYT